MKPIIINIILVLVLVCGSITTSQAQTAEQLYQKGLVKEEGEGALQEAINLYNQVADNSSASISMRAKALLHIGLCHEKLGTQEAIKAYQRLVNNFPSQKNEVAIAKERLNRLIIPVAEKLPETPLIPELTKIKMPASPGNGMLSPDGKQVTFILDGCVWTAPVSGGVDPAIAGEPKRLTGNIGAWDSSNSFCWSGDGKWIAFNAKLEPNANETSIYVVPSEGGDVRKVQVPSHLCGWPEEHRLSLSPDGKTLAYATGFIPGDYQTKNTQIYTIPVNGGKPKELTEPGTQEPVFSPDGSKIAYVKCYKDINSRYYYSDVWVISSEGGAPVQVSNLRSGVVFGPSWSPDGKMIVFSRRPEGDYAREIWIVPVTDEGNPSGPPRKIDLPKGLYHAIAGWTTNNKIGIRLINPEYETIYTVPAAGGIATQVTPQGWTSYPKYSPDGERIYFRWDGGKIASVPSEGGAVDSIKIDSEFDIITAAPGGSNEISPDGKTIVFSGAKQFTENGERRWEVDIFTVPVEGGKPKQLTEISAELQDRFPCWSPDGNSIAFIRPEIVDKEFIMHIYTMSREGENLTKITDRAQKVAYAPIDWAPDGKSITFFTNNNSIRSIPVEGGASTLITEIDSVNSQFELAWSPDGKELAYTDKGKIWIFTPESRVTREIKTGVTAHATKIGWSPDGKKIAFTAFAGGDSELWIMENFLPLERLEKTLEKKELFIRKALADTDIEPIGSPSPDGRYISFTDWDSGGNLGILDLKTKERKLLTDYQEPNEQVYYSSWSPDGQQIAYFWWRYDKDQYNLSVVDVKTGVCRDLLISDKNSWIELGNWSHDGEYFYATLRLSDESKNQLVRVSADDGKIKVLKTFEGLYTGGKPYASPDNSYVAFDLPDKDASGNSDIHILSIENGQETSIIKHPSHDYILGWAPDGGSILFATDRTGTVDAMLINVKNGWPDGNPILVKQNIGSIVPMGFTQDGSFYYGQWRETDNIFSAEIDFLNGKLLTKPSLLIDRFEGRNYSPAYSSNGKYLAYISRRGVLNQGKSGRVLCIRNLETGEEIEIMPDPELRKGDIRHLQWSPDDYSIALACQNKDGYYRIYEYDIQTRKLTPLVTESRSQSSDLEYACPIWAKDGESIFYLQYSRYSKDSRIIVRDILTGVDRELYSYSSVDFMDRLFSLSLSPDGKWLAAINRGENRVIRLISTDNGEIRELLKFKFPGGFPCAQIWSKDGKYIIYTYSEQADNESSREYNLMRINVEGGESQLIEMNNIKGLYYLSLHPDGRNIAFCSPGYSLPENNIWEMKNFMPE